VPARTLAAAALALAAAGCDYDRGDYRTPTDPARQHLVLTVEGGGAASLPADGVSRLRLVAAINPDSLHREVDFTTTAGTLTGGTGASPTARTVTVDGSGRAPIDLQSAAQAGAAVVTAVVKDLPAVAQSLTVAFVAADPGAVLRFVVAPATAPADGATATAVTVEISPLVDPAARTVQFAVVGASFAGGGATASAPAGGDLRATALVVSPAALGEAVVRATVAGTTRETRLRFERALPDRVLLSLSKLRVADRLDDQLGATAALLRDQGAVTAGTEVLFTATRDDTGDAFGFFTASAVVTDATGGATATFTPGGSGYVGPATMTARAPNGRTASVAFQVAAP
jgi:hypothetical protein